jgi:hypothetical protein
MKICQVPAADSHPGVVFSDFTSGVSANGLVNMDNFAHQLNIITCENSSNTPCIQSCDAGGPSDPYGQFSISGCEYQNKLPGTELHSDFYWNVDQFSSCSDLHGRRIRALQSASTDLIAGNAQYFTCKCPDDQDGHSQDQCAEDDRETRFKYIFAEDNDNFDVNGCQNADASAAPTFTSQTTCEIASTGNTWDETAAAGQECTGSVNVPGPRGGVIAVGGQVVVAADLAACEQVATGRTWVSGTAEQTNSARAAAARALGVTWPDTATTTGSPGNICDDGYFPFRGPNADYCKKCLDESGYSPSNYIAHSLCDNTLGADGFLSVATSPSYSDPLPTHMYEDDGGSYNNDYRFIEDTALIAPPPAPDPQNDPPTLNFATKYMDGAGGGAVAKVGIIDFNAQSDAISGEAFSNIKKYWNYFFKDYLTGDIPINQLNVNDPASGNPTLVTDVSQINKEALATRGNITKGSNNDPVEICVDEYTTPSFTGNIGTCEPCNKDDRISNLKDSANPICSLDVNLYGIDENHKNIKSVDNDGNSPCDDELNSNDLGDASCCETDFRYHYAGIGNSENKCYPEIPMLVDSCSGVAPQVDCEKSMTEGDQAGERVLLPCEWDSLNTTCGVAPRRPDMVPAVDVTYMSMPDPFAATGSDDLDFFNSYIDNRSFNYKTGAQFNTACGGTTGENGNFWTWDATTTQVQIKHCNSTIDPTQSSQDVPHARGPDTSSLQDWRVDPGPDPGTQDPLYMSSSRWGTQVQTPDEKRRSVEYGIKGFPTRLNVAGTTLVNNKNGINFVSDTYYYEDGVAREARMTGLPPTPIMATKMREETITGTGGALDDTRTANSPDYNNCVTTCLGDDDCDLIKAVVGGPAWIAPDEVVCSFYKLETRNISDDTSHDIGGYPLVARRYSDSDDCGHGVGDDELHGEQCSLLLQGNDNILVDGDDLPLTWTSKPIVILDLERYDPSAGDIVYGKEGREWDVSGVYLEQDSSDYGREPHENLDHAVAGPVVSWGDYAARPNEPAIYARDSVGRLISPRFTSQVGVAGKAFTYLGLIFGEDTWSYVSEGGGTVNGIVPQNRRYWKKKGEGSNPDIFLFNAAVDPDPGAALWLLSTKLTIYWRDIPEGDKIAREGGFVIAQRGSGEERLYGLPYRNGTSSSGDFGPVTSSWNIFWSGARSRIYSGRTGDISIKTRIFTPGEPGAGADGAGVSGVVNSLYDIPTASLGWKSNPRTKESNENILRTITGVWSDTAVHPPALTFTDDVASSGCSGRENYWCKGEQWISMNKIRN